MTLTLAWSKGAGDDFYVGSIKVDDFRAHYAIRVLDPHQFHLSGGPESIKQFRPLGTFPTLGAAKTYARKDLKFQYGLA